MKTKTEPGNETSVRSPLAAACVACWRGAVAQLRKVRETVLQDARESMQTPDRLLRLALNEAEALAWQTNVPHLVFPTLAVEKVQAVADWNTRQRAVRRATVSA